jgi:putative transcriptional regulator
MTADLSTPCCSNRLSDRTGRLQGRNLNHRESAQVLARWGSSMIPRWQRSSTHAVLDLSRWREFRAHLVQQQYSQQLPWTCQSPMRWGHDRWCHRIATAEQGCLLLANQAGLGYFERSVMLVIATHSHSGSLGLLLNRTSSVVVKDLLVNDGLVRCFGDQGVRLGGCLGRTNLYVLHSERRVQDANCISPGIFSGGLTASMRLIEDGHCQQDDFALFAGYSAWRPGQLEHEIESGLWVAVSAAPSIILDIARGADNARTAWHSLFSSLSERDRTYDSYDSCDGADNCDS